ncbi:MAG: Na+/H+ antiporter NhaC family protein [Alicyclobacillus sp.]|nr:Na+/H+ antiporter NhaC family protein [Alicyclobacillus sp.]
MTSQLAAAEVAEEFPAQTPGVSTSPSPGPAPSPRTDKGRASAEAAKDGDDQFPDPVEIVSERVRPNAWNLVVPLGLLLGLTLWLTWWDGHQRAATLFGALAKANAAKAMLEALLITLVVSVLWYTVQRQPVQRTMFGFLAGGNEMMAVNVLLALVWAVSAVSADLGFVPYTQRAIGHLVPPALIAPVLFLFGCAVSYVIGSSFGTWGMLLPLGFSLAASTHASLPLVAGAVFASGTFGGFASPLSDNTVAMATVMKLPVMRYARYKLWPALGAAGASAALYAVAGLL